MFARSSSSEAQAPRERMYVLLAPRQQQHAAPALLARRVARMDEAAVVRALRELQQWHTAAKRA